MEIFELLFASAQICGCLFDVLTVGVDLWVGTSTYRYVKGQKSKSDDSSQGFRTVALIILLVGAIVMTALLLIRWTNPNHRL